MKKAEVISLVNAKGGSGKTTTASNFAFCLAERGYKVLCIDLDFQCNLSFTLGCLDYNKRRTTIGELINFVNRGVELPEKNEYVVNCLPNLDLIPCNESFTNYNNIFASLAGEEILKNLVYNSGLIDEYDYIIIDNHPNHPNSDPTLKAVLYVSDKLIIPVSPDTFDQQGAFTFINLLISYIKERENKVNLRIAGLLPTRYRKNQIMSDDTLEFCQNSGEYSFKNFIPESTGIPLSHKLSGIICNLDKKNKASKAYEAFTDEYLSLYGGNK